MDVTINVTKTGPIWQAAVTEQVMREYCNAAAYNVARVGMADVVALEKASFKHPTGYYWSRTQIERPANTQNRVVNDSDVIYGPWLEGTSWRNQTTRFKGYAMYRRTAQSLRGKAHRIADGVLRSFIGRLGGR